MKIMPKKTGSNGDRRPIRYENWKGAIAIRYDGNIVLSDIHVQEGKILKKQLKLICLLAAKEAMALKAEGNSPKQKELKY